MQENLTELVDFLESKLANLPPLPCRVDEMTAREFEIFALVAELCGTLQFLTNHFKSILKNEATNDPTDQPYNA